MIKCEFEKLGEVILCGGENCVCCWFEGVGYEWIHGVYCPSGGNKRGGGGEEIDCDSKDGWYVVSNIETIIILPNPPHADTK